MPSVTTVIVTPEESGQKLLQFLQRRVGKDIPKSAIMRWIRKGEVRVDKGRKKPFDRVREGQAVRIPPHHLPAQDNTTLPGLTIHYEDDEILAVAKPGGLAAHGGDGVTDSVAARIRNMYAEAAFIPALAHRLDRDTSGLLVAGKTYESLRRLNDAFATNTVDKIYLARVHGRWKPQETILLEDNMEKRGLPGREKVETGSGKTARAEITPLNSNAHDSLLAVRLLTGRTHQIRVQLSARGHAVLGDVKYGNKKEEPPLMLHCFGLALPEKGARKRILTLAPDWTGSSSVPGTALTKARRLLERLASRHVTGYSE